MPTTPMPTRRRLLTGGAGLIATTAAPAWLTPALAQGRTLQPTPGQTEGPYYPVAFPADTDFDLLRNGAAEWAKAAELMAAVGIVPKGDPTRLYTNDYVDAARALGATTPWTAARCWS